MPRVFNVAGPNFVEHNYIIDPFSRVNWPGLKGLIDGRQYFVLHAPRQTGKTTLLNAMVERLNEEGKYEALYVNFERAQPAREDFKLANQLIVERLVRRARVYLPTSWLASEDAMRAASSQNDAWLDHLLSQWAVHSPKPTVLFIDESKLHGMQTSAIPKKRTLWWLIRIRGSERRGFSARHTWCILVQGTRTASRGARLLFGRCDCSRCLRNPSRTQWHNQRTSSMEPHP